MGSNIFLSKFIGNLLDMYTINIYFIYLKKKQIKGNNLVHCPYLQVTCIIYFFLNELINSAVRTIGAFRGCSEHEHKETKL